MSRIFILTFVLFATLFAVNAAPLALEKRDIQIQPCPGLPPDVVGLDVTVTPDPVVPGTEETFDIKGTMKKDIVTGDFLSIAFIDNVVKQPIGDPLVVDICSLPGATCPTKAGTAFSTTQKYTAPKELPTSYAIKIGIGHHVQPPNVELIACEIALVRKNDQDKNIECPYCGETLPNLLPSKVSEYLNDISTGTNFAKLSNRITELKSDLLKIIKGQRHSEFRVDAVKRIQEIGKSKVGHPLLYQINYFESFQPGYYGPKGLEYLVQVLVPETAIRLIAEDLGGIPLDMAKNVMNDSVEFGFYVHKDSNT
ncbi:hypothetical protein RIR_jg12048.t1 [Rhizophagus irregularis DAOM 181602=DAOM 197198]|nr:hypothetical protein RIR_jg12048.t1 [Rhizophagus irregularis DAOM 181602=DAOM 197198]